jgi:ferredoxin
LREPGGRDILKTKVPFAKGERMPRLEIEGAGAFDVEEGKRLVLAIEEDAGVDIMHACGSYARCATCRVEFLEGEPEEMTRAEMMFLGMRDFLGKARLSCQIYCEEDMKVRVSMTVSGTGARDPGHPPERKITPPPVWVESPY